MILLIYFYIVATVLTVYGIETYDFCHKTTLEEKLQQYLPFTVLKPEYCFSDVSTSIGSVATVLTVYGIETQCNLQTNQMRKRKRCNSTYRLRY